MKQIKRVLVRALVLGLVGTTGALYAATGDDFEFKAVATPASVPAPGGSVSVDIILATDVDGTEGWSLGMILDADPGVTASITGLAYSPQVKTVKAGDPPDFAVLEWYDAGDPGTKGICDMGQPCVGINAAAFTQAIVVDLMEVVTMPATPGIVVLEATVDVAGPPGTEARLSFTDDVGTPAVSTVVSHGGPSFPPSVQQGATISIVPEPSTFWLLLTGLVAAVGFALQRRSRAACNPSD